MGGCALEKRSVPTVSLSLHLAIKIQPCSPICKNHFVMLNYSPRCNMQVPPSIVLQRMKGEILWNFFSVR